MDHKDTTPLLIIALGNPGDEYHNTRHNAGWIILGGMLGNVEWEKDNTTMAYIYRSHLGKREVIYVKPQTFMNRSGISVKKMMMQKRMMPDDLIVVHDDIDLPTGEIRVSYNRGSGGHNGVESVISALGTKAFVRIRIGIAPTDLFGRMRRHWGDAKDFVLKPFSRREYAKIVELSHDCARALEKLAGNGREAAMNEVNGRD